MRPFVLPLCLSLFLAFSGSICLPAIADDSDGKKEGIVIVSKKPYEDKNVFRAPAFIPIAAEYSYRYASIYVYFAYEVGVVNVEISNLNTGETVSETIDSGFDSHVIPISGSPGAYCLSFVLESGSEYYGEFEIK